MPRRARLAMAGIPWHIIQRGNNRTACFYCADDYLRYLRDLAEQSTKLACHIHAYCLMTNHVHLLIGNDVLGDARFNAEIEAMLRRRVTPGKVGRPAKT